jgi:hypothetical protein
VLQLQLGAIQQALVQPLLLVLVLVLWLVLEPLVELVSMPLTQYPVSSAREQVAWRLELVQLQLEVL